jgi:hypothetical protein
MKKILIGIAAVVLLATMIATVYAPPPATFPDPVIPAPTFCGCPPCGFTPGFWKHNVRVRLASLGLDDFNGAYNAFEGGPLDGVKLTDALMDGYLADINSALGTTYDFEDMLGFLTLPGWHSDRTNTANWFNKVAGYGPY